jgi:hypothetical protein
MVKHLKDIDPEELKKLMAKLDAFAKEEAKIFGEVVEFTGASNLIEAYKTLGEILKESLSKREVRN